MGRVLAATMLAVLALGCPAVAGEHGPTARPPCATLITVASKGHLAVSAKAVELGRLRLSLVGGSFLAGYDLAGPPRLQPSLLDAMPKLDPLDGLSVSHNVDDGRLLPELVGNAGDGAFTADLVVIQAGPGEAAAGLDPATFATALRDLHDQLGRQGSDGLLIAGPFRDGETRAEPYEAAMMRAAWLAGWPVLRVTVPSQASPHAAAEFLHHASDCLPAVLAGAIAKALRRGP